MDNLIKYNQDIVNRIPERTKKLLWITNEEPDEYYIQWSNIPFLLIRIPGARSIEPSLIYTKLPVAKPDNPQNVESLRYWPSYLGLDPYQRWDYLNWLYDISKSIDIGYVFLYYYGLERHLLMGNFESAFEEIIHLINYHDNKSFKKYSITALLISCYNTERYNFIKRIPYDPENTDYEFVLLFKAIKNIKILPEEAIGLCNKVGFKNRNYIKKYPELFKKILSEKLLEDENKNGSHLLERINWEKAPKKTVPAYANMSIPAEIRFPTINNIIAAKGFKKTLFKLLSEAHQEIKDELASERKKINKK